MQAPILPGTTDVAGHAHAARRVVCAAGFGAVLPPWLGNKSRAAELREKTHEALEPGVAIFTGRAGR